MVRCKARRKETTCVKDGICTWNGTSCESDSYDELLNICASKKGKAKLVVFAKKLAIDVKKMTIPALCTAVSAKLETMGKEQKAEARAVFNSIIKGDLPAPIVTDKEVGVLVAPPKPTDTSRSAA